MIGRKLGLYYLVLTLFECKFLPLPPPKKISLLPLPLFFQYDLITITASHLATFLNLFFFITALVL